MVAYEFYIKDQERGTQLLGILPERRRTPGRVNQESVMNWARMAFSNLFDINKIFFIRVSLESEGNHFYSVRSKDGDK
jgi:hypothetical protein